MEGLCSAVPPLVALSLLLSIGNSLDIILFLTFKAYKDWQFIQQFIQVRIDLKNVIYISKYVASLFIAFQAWRFIAGLRRSESCNDEFPVRPMLFPCQTSHVRMFPKRHGFSYSYLLVGIPVGWEGNSGGMLSSEEEESRSLYRRWLSLKNGVGWWTVDSDHYLARGHNENGLAGKLQRYLESQKIDPKRYTHAYLLTAARFLNYASNPVSIWHLYSSSKALTALILEVNNTSDERRIYFLEPTSIPLSKDPNLPSIRYTGTWNKDFYVSTFNDRSGKYSIAAYDPLFPDMARENPEVNCTITLTTGGDRAMLIARVYSAGKALDPASMSIVEKLRFLGKWWWVGFMTFFPRTVWEAWKLFAKRGVAWVSRPEPRRGTMSRCASALETPIERQFRGYLNDRVASSKQDLEIRYIPAGLVGHLAKEQRIARSTLTTPDENKILEIRVLTPLFYSRIVEYSNIHTGLLLEAQSATIEISNPALLQYLNLDPSPSSPPKISLTALYLHLIKNLRFTTVPAIPSLEKSNPPSPVSLPSISTPTPTISTVAKTNSGLDICTPISSSSLAAKQETRAYLLSTLKILWSERLALGWIEILDFEIFIFRILVIWFLARGVS